MKTKNSKRTMLNAGRICAGLTLIELMVAVGISSIVMLSAVLLVHSGYQSWNQTYNDAYSEARLGALDAMVSLGAIGRKSNRNDYRFYRVAGSDFELVTPTTDPEEVVTGQAVEFRYWDTELDETLMDPARTATAYALFYLDDDELKVDFGPFPPSGVDAFGHRISSADVTTVTLARDVVDLQFSHTTRNMAGDGKGCIRMRLTVNDPTDESTKTTVAATLMRNEWPH